MGGSAGILPEPTLSEPPPNLHRKGWGPLIAVLVHPPAVQVNVLSEKQYRDKIVTINRQQAADETNRAKARTAAAGHRSKWVQAPTSSPTNLRTTRSPGSPLAIIDALQAYA